VKDVWSHSSSNGGYHVAERGKTFYYADYRASGGRKDYFPEPWSCCSGTFIQDVADYYNLMGLACAKAGLTSAGRSFRGHRASSFA
jgi:hypothetical protein